MSTGDYFFTVLMISKLKRKYFSLIVRFGRKDAKHEFDTCLSAKCLCCAAPFFPAGMFLTLTGRVYQPLQDIKECRPNSLSSRVSSKINHALWEPLFPQGAPPHIHTHTLKKMQPPRLASSCLSACMTSAPGPVTRAAGHPQEKGHSGAFKRCRHLSDHVLSQSEERDQWPTSANR